MPAAAPAALQRFPPQIKFIVGNEACERFSFYGVRAILTLYISKHLGLGPVASAEIVHLFIFGVYFVPLFGAWLSDRILGRYRTILYLSLFYCLGHLVLAFSDLVTTTPGKLALLYTGLTLLSFGAGGIKPCASAFVGDQFSADQGHLLQRAYAWFYWSINFGSFFAFLWIPRIRESLGYGWAFGVPGLFMGAATLIFWLGTRHYRHVPPAGESPRKILRFIPLVLLAGLYLTLRALGVPTWILGTGVLALLAAAATRLTLHLQKTFRSGQKDVPGDFYETVAFTLANLGHRQPGQSLRAIARSRFDEPSVDGTWAALRVLSIFALIPFFWALWDQNSTTWVIQGDKLIPYELNSTARLLFGWLTGDRIGAEQMQSLNALVVMILVPLFTYLAFPALKRLGIRITTLRRITVGLFLASTSFVMVALIEQQLTAGAKLSILVQCWPYIALTAGEVLVSTTGLEFAFREAPESMRSTLMSFWLLTIAVGNLAVSRLFRLNVRGKAPDGSELLYFSGEAQFWIFAGLLALVAVLFALIATRYRYRDPIEAREAGQSDS